MEQMDGQQTIALCSRAADTTHDTHMSMQTLVEMLVSIVIRLIESSDVVYTTHRSVCTVDSVNIIV